MKKQNDYVILIGTKGGPAIRTNSSMPTANLIYIDGQEIIVDCGLGVTQGLVKQGFQLKNIENVFITHLHSDHYIELGPMIHTAWTTGLKTNINIWGPDGLQKYWDAFVNSMKDDIDLRIDDEGRPDIRGLVTINAINEGAVAKINNIKVNAIKTIHPPLINCFALSFESENSRVVFSGDTAPMDSMITFAKDADLLIHEAMLEEALPALMGRIGNASDKLMKHWLQSHSFAHDVAQLAAKANVKQLALSHLIPADDPEYSDKHWEKSVRQYWDKPLFIGKDGMKIVIDSN